MLLKLRTWWAKVRLVGQPRLDDPNNFYADRLHFSEYAEAERDSSARLEPYDGLAEVWHDYARPHQANYSAFLRGLVKAHRQELRAVLDLACGTGALSKSLARVASEVVGVDASEAMLSQARTRFADLPSVHYVQGDFRDFSVERQFDAAVCAFNSINYVANVTELGAVFRSVAKHLRPGGWFVFDTITEAGMSFLSPHYLHVRTKTHRFAMRFEYDKALRQETATVMLPKGTEIHRRVPVDPKDVVNACQNSGLVVNDYFSNAFFPGWQHAGLVCYFVLRKV